MGILFHDPLRMRDTEFAHDINGASLCFSLEPFLPELPEGDPVEYLEPEGVRVSDRNPVQCLLDLFQDDRNRAYSLFSKNGSSRGSGIDLTG